MAAFSRTVINRNGISYLHASCLPGMFVLFTRSDAHFLSFKKIKSGNPESGDGRRMFLGDSQGEPLSRAVGKRGRPYEKENLHQSVDRVVISYLFLSSNCFGVHKHLHSSSVSLISIRLLIMKILVFALVVSQHRFGYARVPRLRIRPS